jgi:hypothetical protein
MPVTKVHCNPGPLISFSQVSPNVLFRFAPITELSWEMAPNSARRPRSNIAGGTQIEIERRQSFDAGIPNLAANNALAHHLRLGMLLADCAMGIRPDPSEPPIQIAQRDPSELPYIAGRTTTHTRCSRDRGRDFRISESKQRLRPRKASRRQVSAGILCFW